MSTILETAVLSLQTWNEVRNDGAATRNYFNQGAYFQISRDNFNQWNLNAPSSLHAYMGLTQAIGQTNFSLALYCVDNITDSKPVPNHLVEFNTNIKQSIYQRSVLPNAHFIFEKDPPDPVKPQIDTLTALKDSKKWILHKDHWLLRQKDFVQVFIIPFENLSHLFANENVTNIVLLPALNEVGENDFELHLILWGHTLEGMLANYPVDGVRANPPYHTPSNFQLLDYALSSK